MKRAHNNGIMAISRVTSCKTNKNELTYETKKASAEESEILGRVNIDVCT